MPFSAPPISVLVVEDDDKLRQDFSAMVATLPDMTLLHAADTLASARAAIARLGAPDVLVIDLGLPDGDGTTLIGELTESRPSTGALVITVFGDEAHVLRAVEAGARGYLLKDASLQEFERAVRQVREGGAPLSPMIARHLLKRFTLAAAAPRPLPTKSAPPLAETLTAREREILRLIADGNSIAETAAVLFLSPHTVNTHVKRIYGKLAVNNRVQAVNRARAIGQLD